jgi:hypothetical protein
MRDIILRREKQMLECFKELNACLNKELAKDRPSERDIKTYKDSIRILEKSLGWV